MTRIRTNQTLEKVGESVVLIGWVQARRDHGKLIFIDVRDRWGLMQVVFTRADKELLARANKLRSEWVIKLDGVVKARPENMVNPDLVTGMIEIAATGLEVFSESKTPPFALDTDGREIGEEHRLTYRYLDLRRERMKRNLIMRDAVIALIRQYLHKRDFLEIETPLLTKSTPEGARDYVVPSRRYPGAFFALPQSPQQYKQLLMVAGIERYFQIARCFRDEDTRGDRQPEFTQLDIEMSFIDRDDILNLIEDLYTQMVKTLYPKKHFTFSSFPRLSHKEAMEKYRSDKPDLRKNKNDPHELAFAFVVDFPMFEEKDDGSLGATHHPFTLPTFDINDNPYSYNHDRKEAFKMRKTLARKNRQELLGLRAYQYDFVCNGYEICGGSIRTHDPDLLRLVFEALGHSQADVKDKFGHMLEAFSYGVPPHGGIASGLDRLLMILQGEPNIREVIAFPK
ncbi:MAG: aspartyl-tRNA synthetase, partial [Parcubacteria group bacterium Gr01-1014_66]